MKSRTISQDRTIFIVKRTSLYFVLLLVFTVMALMAYYHFDVTMKNIKFNQVEQHHLNSHKATIERKIDMTLNILDVFNAHYMEMTYSGNQFDLPGEFEHEMQMYCRSFSDYLQFRLIGNDGMEKVRVNCPNNKANVVPTEQLQDKSKRDYFQHVQSLRKGEIYISRMELNQEHGEIEIPFRPVVRMAIALIDDKGNQDGYIFINIDARSFFHYHSNQEFFNTQVSPQGGYVFILTTLGTTYNSVPEPMKQNNIDPSTGSFSFARHYPADWQKIGLQDSGAFYNNRGLYNFLTYEPGWSSTTAQGEKQAHRFVYNNELSWKIVSFVPVQKLTFGDIYFYKKLGYLLPVLLLIQLLIAYFFSLLQWQKKSLDKQLDDNRLYLEMVTDNITDGLVSVNQDGQVNQVNAIFFEMFGYSVNDSIHRDISHFIPRLSIKDGIVHCKETDNGCGRILRKETEARTKNGDAFPVEITISEVSRSSNLIGTQLFILLIHDLSEINATAKELETLHLMYRHREKMAEVGVLVGGILHEVSNPMAAIQGLLEELSDTQQDNGKPLLNSTAADNVKLALEHVSRLKGISYEISTFLKPATNEKDLLDLNGLVRSTHNLLKYDQRWGHMTIKLELDPQLPLVYGIGDQLIQVIINLMVNAADAYESVKEREHIITIKSEYASDDFIMLSFKDNACGMNDDVMKNIFKQFYTTKHKGKGTGLGLPLCEAIISDHNGMIEVDSVEGVGTIIRILLPIDTEFREELLCAN